MWRFISRLTIIIGVLAPVPAAAEPVSFSRDIRPLLASRCFACHGPDDKARQGELRLDTLAGATAKHDRRQAIVPGRSVLSELVRRISSPDLETRMPPPDAGNALSQSEQELLERWIDEGADYQEHWAFVSPKRPVPPRLKQQADWLRNPIDHFVLARLQQQGLHPSERADRYTLVRRLYLDLIGLPPTPAEADAFVSDDDPRAYEELVDRLLDSKHYGERWARAWLDLARYSDTNGYEKDRPRSIWPYRDWVVQALNADMPYNQFSIEQLAGDMLPRATESQRVATGFHRNTMLNEEGGIDPLEYRFYAMVDRVATTGLVWMGLTVGCAQCHSHKYDPVSHSDYYRFLALMNNAEEPDLDVTSGNLRERRVQLTAQWEEMKTGLAGKFPLRQGEPDTAENRRQHLQEKLAAWLAVASEQAVDWTVIRPVELDSNLPKLDLLEDGSVFSRGDVTKRDLFQLRFDLGEQFKKPLTALRLEVMADDRLPAGGPGRAFYEGRRGDFFLSELRVKVNGKDFPFAAGSHSYGKISVGSGGADAKNVFDGDGSTGWSTSERPGEPHQLVLNFSQPLVARGKVEIELLFERHFVASLGRFRFAVTSDEKVKASSMPVGMERLLVQQETARTATERNALQQYFLSIAPELAAARKPLDRLRKQIPSWPQTLVLRERAADNVRPTFRHHRGEYLSPREAVVPGLPTRFASGPGKQPQNRLELARWLVSERNPLVARVHVNRTWRALFGSGLVRSSGDFGTQSAPPTHPQLLDWLAVEWVSRGWSMKQLHRLIVNSATYQQGSGVTPEGLRIDPENRWLARGPRYRLDAEVLRDVMLRSSGLLSPRLGGASVYPPQPASVVALAYGGNNWKVSTGADRYRRSLYTFNKRTSPFAAYTTFDAPTGENCIVRRNRSNTPLQALTLLNDEMFLEMARALANRVVKARVESPEARAQLLFRYLLTRPAQQEELATVLVFREKQLKRLQDGELKAAQITGEKEPDAELASWVMVARTLMNLDETITRH
ncbi:MAG: PSD1 and planctomycete cytochrome C domain-containing protein [Pirellulaceae bacterium]